MGVLSYSPLTGGWLSGRWRKDAGQQSSSRAERLPERFDLSTPANQRKLDAVEQLAQLADEAGITLIQLAIAFVLNHPAITAPIIGPRTMEQLESQLAAADVTLDEAVLDRIDEIVPPGIDRQPRRQLLRQPGASADGATPLRGGPAPSFRPPLVRAAACSAATSRRASRRCRGASRPPHGVGYFVRLGGLTRRGRAFRPAPWSVKRS